MPVPTIAWKLSDPRSAEFFPEIARRERLLDGSWWVAGPVREGRGGRETKGDERCNKRLCHDHVSSRIGWCPPKLVPRGSAQLDADGDD